MTDPDPIKPGNRHINLTYGTAVALVVLMLSVLILGGWFIYSLRSELSDFKGINACRSEVAEDERKATLDVTVGLGELFITAILDREALVPAVNTYRETVSQAQTVNGRDVAAACS